MMGLKKPSTPVVLFVMLVLCCCCYTTNAAQALVLSATIRDQAPDTMAHAKFPQNYWQYNGWNNNPTTGSCGDANGGLGWSGTDFELPLYMYGTIRTPNAPGGVLYNGEVGLVGNVCNASNAWVNCARLGADKTPQYAYPGRSPFGAIQSPQSFYNWFHPGQQTVSVLYNLTLPSIGGRLYRYDSNGEFFPIDNRGWRDSGKADSGNFHNFAYCMEIHGHFSYQGGETFEFRGDDDVWAYLDQRLVIDLGGIHTQLSATINLDNIAGLTQGTNYRFDFFYCERHTSLSTLKITTSIEIACTYYDWCDICEGNGQSCCTAQDIAKCNDNNACTADKCAVLVPPNIGCQNTDISQNCPSNACYKGGCDKLLGCTIEQQVCDDNKKCTIDTCNNATGCVFTPKVCSGGDKCNIPKCDDNTGECVFTTTVCNDNNLCTTDKCDPVLGCQYTAKTCPMDACLTSAVCSTATGLCVNTSKICNDNDPCTNDICDPQVGCLFTTIPCGDDNKCKIWSCTKAQNGCLSTDVPCDDHDECTIDDCDPKIGCTHKARECNDGDECTIDSCDSASGCTTTPRVCNDNSKCTNDTCDSKLGCLFNQLPCDDKNACTDDVCTPLGGCTFTPKICDDHDMCTNNTCVPATGCVYPPTPCDDHSPCTLDSCLPADGCHFEPQDCDRCLVDGVPKVCTPQGGNKCFPVECDPKTGNCTIVNEITCNDNDLCTNDSCVPGTGACSYIAVSCDDHDLCTDDSCDSATGCKHTKKNCDDNNPCTTDSCGADGNCLHVDVAGECIACAGLPCTWTDVCNPKICTAQGQCVVSPVDCDDKNLCTTDRCDNSTATADCKHINKQCNVSNLCALESCDVATGNCKLDASNLDCDDANPCTTDLCVVVAGAAKCDYVYKQCPGTFCAPQACDEATGNCLLTAQQPNCDDLNECTIDACVNAATSYNCTHTLRDCSGYNTGELCTPPICVESIGCTAGNWTCDDGNFCTKDSCVGVMNCSHVDDSSFLCDDNNGCTVDVCNASSPILAQACSHYNKTCISADICFNATGCNATSEDGCIFTPIICPPSGDFCQVPKCDEVAGCITIPRPCIVDDPDCYEGICDSVSSQCISVERDDWTTITTQKGNGVTCYAFYNKAQTAAIITGGVIAGIVVGAVVFAAAAAVAARKAYLYMQLKQGPMGGAQSNPLYTPGASDGVNPLYR